MALTNRKDVISDLRKDKRVTLNPIRHGRIALYERQTALFFR